MELFWLVRLDFCRFRRIKEGFYSLSGYVCVVKVPSLASVSLKIRLAANMAVLNRLGIGLLTSKMANVVRH
ncbi:hypothetical protein BFS14_00490 [Serratia fonticola]|jgi:hypothetical protein|uniref:hypothetical protein n=1 Tax=Serratia fonticola TaxID=47917 RepID=UPI0008FD1D60|nr:hypothetical protein [Serratia fonticola]MBC3249185.1 hypothetical protein [Serratia fonticola]NXZ87314.1 hypothetical protein [Serratia fonticola]OIX95978.1 hypothetical protein BFS14_00490 [Serratia fonticola]QCR61094.1 hypothetical protein FD644_12280 [Serratia fonticola]QIP94047.1 hypothetical protein HAP32_04567 [Serratia fonticola]